LEKKLEISFIAYKNVGYNKEANKLANKETDVLTM